MTPRATHIDEEGVYIDNFKLVDRGKFREKELYALLRGAKYPARWAAMRTALGHSSHSTNARV